MQENRAECHNDSVTQRFVAPVLVLSLAVVAFLTYRDMLNYYFADPDGLALIATGRVESAQDLIRIFTEPLMNGTTFSENGRFYRPISSLSYGLVYSIWGLEPFGYHLFDLILHILNTVLVFFLMQRLTGGRKIIAWLSAVIFTTHPIIEACVPADGRHDVIVTLFLLLTLLFFLRSLASESSGRMNRVYSLLFYIVAFGSKEIAVIIPVLIFSYAVLTVADSSSLREKVRAAVWISLPYVAVTVPLLLWRSFVLHGVGGYAFKHEPYSVAQVVMLVCKVIKEYFVDLLYPFGKSPFHAVPSIFERVIAISLVIVLLLLVKVFRQELFGRGERSTGRVKRIFKFLVATSFIVSLIGILGYPLVAGLINAAIADAYSGKGISIISAAMKGKSTVPVEYYFYAARNAVFSGFSLLLFFSLLCLVIPKGVQHRRNIANFFLSSSHTALLLFLLTWTLLPLGIYLFMLSHAHRAMYVAVIPFSGLLAIAIVEGIASARRSVEKYQGANISYEVLLREPSVMGAGIAVVIVGMLFFHSPLLQINGEYGERKDIGMMWSLFFSQLEKIVPTLPHDTTLRIINFPDGISSYQKQVPHSIAPTSLNEYSVKAWIDFRDPTNRINVLPLCYSWYETTPSTLELTVERETDNSTTIIVQPNVLVGPCRGPGSV